MNRKHLRLEETMSLPSGQAHYKGAVTCFLCYFMALDLQ